MSWVVTDDTPTATVLWMAAEQIGKAQNHDQIQKICDYLVNKHWFQTAGDLRSARRETTEWQALEVPGRLKLAIQQVLDQATTYGYEDYYAAVRPSLTPGSEATTDQQWAQAATEYTTETTADYYSGGYAYTNGEATTSACYDYDQTGYTAANEPPPSYDESSGYHSYYSSSSDSSYQESGAATTLLSLQGSSEHPVESDVVEAHAVDAEVAEECVEGEMATYPAAVELGAPSQREATDTSGTWSCSQCTFLNQMTSSFCEMCIGHISLSPDVKTTAGTSVSASLLIPAKHVVEVVADAPATEPLATSFTSQPIQPSVTCMLPPVGSLYSPSAPDFDDQPSPPPPPYSGTNSYSNVNFLALAFNGSSASKTQATEPQPTAKTSQMRREEATIEYTF